MNFLRYIGSLFYRKNQRNTFLALTAIYVVFLEILLYLGLSEAGSN